MVIDRGPARRHTSASYSLTIRTETANLPGTLARVLTAIGNEGGNLGQIEMIESTDDRRVREIVVMARDEAHGHAIVDHLSELEGVHLAHVIDRTFRAHEGGKIEVVGRSPIATREDLSMVYTPGVARVCMAIRDEPSTQWTYTSKQSTVAVVTDGSAVLGLGNIGPAAAQPVMEGKCVIFKTFADVNAFPICLATQDPDEIVATVERIAPVFGGINIEDIAAPQCFEIEARLRSRLDIPVMHDDQHATAIVVLAALTNALKLVGKSLDAARIVINGSGAAGIATARILLLAGAKDIVLCDRAGVVAADRADHMNPYKSDIARVTNPRGVHGTVGQAMRAADAFIGLSAPGAITIDDVAAMGRDPIVFAMANPEPEIRPEALIDIARVVGTGRSDYPNQINNSLAFPGLFRGALDTRAREINDEMKLAAAAAIADLVASDELADNYIIPSMFDRRVAPAVIDATRRAAIASGVARVDTALSS
ncbi:MAG: NAD-dependent malic enzyme [Chloroflexota bacterium]|nr:MAG: NAD-dependent malic enzyme [Chloroflexota bacterium]